MNAISLGTRAPLLRLVSFAVALLVSACGSTVAADRDPSIGQPAAVGSSTLDYSTLGHMGLLQTSVGSSSLDYDTLAHMGLLQTSVGSSSLDYDTLRHIGRLELSQCPWSAAGC